MNKEVKEKENRDIGQQLNVLRAGVLGANDGIVSVAGVVIGVAAAGAGQVAIVIAGLSAILAGAFSMAGGEYVSVSTQADTEKAAVEKQKVLLEKHYDEELSMVVDFYEHQGLSKELASEVANYQMSHNALKTTVDIKYNLEEGVYTNPWHAAFSSFFSFAVGSMLPFLTAVFIPHQYRIIGTVIAVAISLCLTGYFSAKLGNAIKGPAVLRNLTVGLLTMIVTYVVGILLHV